jgi:hypothetical protein
VIGGAIVLAGVAVAIGIAARGGGDDARALPRAPAPVRPSAHHSYLFAHDATSGALTPVAGEQGQWDLTLNGVAPTALYFTDRPFRQAGVVPLHDVLEGFFVAQRADDDPPNAAINVLADHAQDLGAVELLSGRYDAKARRLVYRVRALAAGGAPVPRRFGDASVYIDDGGHQCTGEIQNYLNTNLDSVGQSKWSTDDWVSEPRNASPVTSASLAAEQSSTSFGVGQYVRLWTSDGGLFRGCGNSAVWSASGIGTVTASLSDPWHDTNTWHCTFTPAAGVDPHAVGCSASGGGGDQLTAVFDVCAHDSRFVATWSCEDLGIG